MPKIKLQTLINAPIERVFDLARCIDLHAESLTHTNEKAIEGKTKGLINLGETVTWEAIHFGIRQKLTSKITQFDYPKHFRDSMISGAFSRFDHDHFFEQVDGKTLMLDIFDYDSPFGFLGKFADSLFLKTYMKNLLIVRNKLIKNVAESDEWQNFLV
jgi:ligand-binding SRPBCC domain-containing protein